MVGTDRQIIGASLLAVLCGGVLFAFQAGYRVNLSRSLPIGIYQLIDGPPMEGGLVTFCVPARLAHLEVFSRTTVKVCIDGKGAPLLKRVIEVIPATGDLIVRGDTPRSVDSRIFGPLKQSEISAVVIPVWVEDE